jgi:hypothetical protein
MVIFYNFVFICCIALKVYMLDGLNQVSIQLQDHCSSVLKLICLSAISLHLYNSKFWKKKNTRNLSSFSFSFFNKEMDYKVMKQNSRLLKHVYILRVSFPTNYWLNNLNCSRFPFSLYMQLVDKWKWLGIHMLPTNSTLFI